MATWWFTPLSKWVLTQVISGLTPLIPYITRVTTCYNPPTKWDEPPSTMTSWPRFLKPPTPRRFTKQGTPWPDDWNTLQITLLHQVAHCTAVPPTPASHRRLQRRTHCNMWKFPKMRGHNHIVLVLKPMALGFAPGKHASLIVTWSVQKLSSVWVISPELKTAHVNHANVIWLKFWICHISVAEKSCKWSHPTKSSFTGTTLQILTR